MVAPTLIVVFMCPECHRVPVVIPQAKPGTAQMLQKLVVCEGCSDRFLAKMKAEWAEAQRVAGRKPEASP